MQIETNRQLQQLNRKKGKPGGEGTGPGGRTELTDKGCRVLTIEEARLRKRRAEKKLEADVQKQQRLEKRQEKAFEQAMIESPMGGIYEARAAAEPGESIVFKTMNSLSGSDTGRAFRASVVEVLKPEFFIVAPEERSEHYQHLIPRLKKDKVKRGYAHYGKAENLGVWTTVMARTKDEWTFVHISFPLDDSSNLDLDVV